jgi:hypothetical protein
MMTPKNWIYLSRPEDDYIKMLADGAGVKTTLWSDFNYDATPGMPIVIRSMVRAKKIIPKCVQDNRDFYYVDTGYIGNHTRSENPKGHKHYHRIVKNGLQHSKIIDRPDDRLKQCPVKYEKWKKPGSKILLVTPSEKPCDFYKIDRDIWVEQTIAELKKHTDREIVVRDKHPIRNQRIKYNSMYEALDNDIWALVTYQSIAAVESVLYGYPAFSLAPSAAEPVTYNDLSKIETPFIPDEDLRYKWACHLAYGQFHVREMADGTAVSILKNEW